MVLDNRTTGQLRALLYKQGEHMPEKEGFYKIFYITDKNTGTRIKQYAEMTIIVKATSGDRAREVFNEWVDQERHDSRIMGAGSEFTAVIVKIEHIITPEVIESKAKIKCKYCIARDPKEYREFQWRSGNEFRSGYKNQHYIIGDNPTWVDCEDN